VHDECGYDFTLRYITNGQRPVAIIRFSLYDLDTQKVQYERTIGVAFSCIQLFIQAVICVVSL